MAEELLDVFDEGGKKTENARTMEEVHRLGLWHQAVDIWIYNSKGEILLQKRSKTVHSHPGLWDISACGHVSAGENIEEAALRELKEELGIEVDYTDLTLILKRKAVGNYDELNWHNKEFDYVYLLKLDAPHRKIQNDEVEAVKFMHIDRFEKELRDLGTVKKYVPRIEYYLRVIKLIRRGLKKSG
jgi:isopentenyl-diphosphate delta-isomerase type 1